METEEEQILLKKIQERKIKHKEASQKYRDNNKNKIAEYNKKYNESQKIKLKALKAKYPNIEQQPTPINIQQEPPKINKRTRRGKKQTPTTGDIMPSYETMAEQLEYSTIDQYISQANIIKKIFNKKSLSQEAKGEIRKLLNDIDENKVFDFFSEKVIEFLILLDFCKQEDLEEQKTDIILKKKH